MLRHCRTPEADAKRVLSLAADIVEKRGWRQGSWGEQGAGSVCVEGAIAEAGIQLGLAPEQLAGPITVVRKTVGGSIPAWNDAAGRNKEQAIDLLRVCAAASGDR